MHFTSLTFILFLTVVFGLYWSLRAARHQNLIIVLASYTFYGWWDSRFCALILISSLIDFFIGGKIGRTENRAKRKLLLAISLTCNLGLLALFKYYGFFAENFLALAQTFGWTPNNLTLNLILPVGISFYTFQTLSYTIDVYRGQLKHSLSVIDYLAFVSFFPQLVAGPIERGTNLLPQFQNTRSFNRVDATDGCRLVLWGFFKKLAIADVLAVQVDATYARWEIASGAELALATVFFAFQIYCDFSAYSDIAIGTARLFSIKLMRNFAYPYFSQSLSEFWGRWHISLSTWFRDYVYIPLGGNRHGPIAMHRNIILTFLLSGLWHGAAWTFVVWGTFHGLGLVAEKTFRLGSKRVPIDFSDQPNLLVPVSVTLKMLLTFACVCLGWVFFRATSIDSAFVIVGKIVPSFWAPDQWSALVQLLDNDKRARIAFVMMLIFAGIEWANRKHPCPLTGYPKSITWGRPVRWFAYTAVILLTLDLMAAIETRAFIYFAF